jgi:hypothetical protein
MRHSTVRTQSQGKFYVHHSVHCESIPKEFQQDDTLVQYFINSCNSLYMFRVKQSPIIRSSIKLYLQHLVLINRVWPAVVVDESELGTLFINTRCSKYSLIELLMMGDSFTQNM